MQEVSATDYDDWQFGMMAALLPRVYDEGWVYASHGCEESTFVIAVAMASDEGSHRAGEIITKLLRDATTESDTRILSLLIGTIFDIIKTNKNQIITFGASFDV